MQNNRLGCLTGTGIFAALITFAALVGIAFTSGAQMFSAGNLNAQAGESVGGVTAHAQIAECSACHAAPWESDKMADRCVQCHQDVALQSFDTNSLHSIIAQKKQIAACRDCHPEHRGAASALTEFDASDFPHESFGFSLNAHQINILHKPFTCDDCHKGDLSNFALSVCIDCHRQIDAPFIDSHVIAYGVECLACHDGVDRYNDDFSHNTFFSLDGKHAVLDCTQCHVNARSISDLQSAPTDCFSCHQKDDAHTGIYGMACGVCHNPEGWTPAKFDHNLADFKLEGKHVNVVCEKCHVNKVFKGTASDCYSCHQKDDQHNGQFGIACETCHNPSSWDNAIFDHNLSAFKLDGAHVNVTCEGCHINNIFKGTPATCVSCHQKDDEHNGQFGKDCAGCHTTASWDAVNFDHNQTNFPLNGSHTRVQCEDCHRSGTFAGLSTECASCHIDPSFHAGAFGANCATCHSVSSWSPAGFNIQHPEPRVGEGGNGINHGGATCKQCHPSTVYQATCVTCHEGGIEGGEDGEGGDD